MDGNGKTLFISYNDYKILTNLREFVKNHKIDIDEEQIGNTYVYHISSNGYSLFNLSKKEYEFLQSIKETL